MTDQVTPEKKGKRKNINRWREARLRRLKAGIGFGPPENDARTFTRIQQLTEMLPNE